MSLASKTLFFSLALCAFGATATAADVMRSEVPAAATSAVLRIALPGGGMLEHTYARAADAAAIDARSLIGSTAVDGVYHYELSFAQSLDESAALAAVQARRNGNDAAVVGAPKPLLPISGTFAVRDGQLQMAGPKESSAGSGQTSGPVPNDQVIADDLIVQGSICAGFDCVNNESFGFDTLRLKENNTRIKFEDTSAAGSFATDDWQLTANDSASGGLDKFSIENVSQATVPFTLVGAAPSNSIYVASTGRVGFRTSTPVLDLHVATSNTPALRLEQTAAGGFSAQTWDMGGNEANFFVRDVTNGSALPLRIRPGAASSSIDINSNGNVGIGIASAQAKLHVNGDAYVAGTLTQLSSRTSKTNLVAVAADGVLDSLSRLPIWTWNYLRSDLGDRHIGPVAEDFYAAFGFGTSERQLAPSDVAGVALAATQALQHQVVARDRTIAALEARLARLEKILADRESNGDSTTSGH
jgi:hypothetical protein